MSDPSATPIAAVGGIVHDERGRLLVIRRGQAPSVGTWSIPGGRVEPGESLQEACAREVLEETGIAVTVGALVGVVERAAPGGGMYVIRDFVATPQSGRSVPPTAATDATDARWVTADELADLTTAPGLLEALTGWDMLPRS